MGPTSAPITPSCLLLSAMDSELDAQRPTDFVQIFSNCWQAAHSQEWAEITSYTSPWSFKSPPFFFSNSEIFTFTTSSPLKARRRERKTSLGFFCFSIPILYRRENEDKVCLSTHMHIIYLFLTQARSLLSFSTLHLKSPCQDWNLYMQRFI